MKCSPRSAAFTSATASRPLETPAIEYTDALGKFLPDQDRPNDGVFSFQDDDEQWMSLRYDLTAPLARYVARELRPCRSRIAVMRSAGSFATRSRARAASASSCSSTPTRSAPPSVAADAEICMLAADTLEALGHQARRLRDQGQQPQGARRGAGGHRARRRAKRGQRLTVLRAIDKLDRLGPDGVRQLLGAGRKDESGDFTKGAGLAPEPIETSICAFVWQRWDDWEPAADRRDVR